MEIIKVGKHNIIDGTQVTIQSMDAFLGSWKMEKSEGFDEVMQRLGVGFLTRKAGNASRPTLTLSKNGDEYTLKTVSTFKNGEINFKLGEPFDETTLDGRQVKSTFTMEGAEMKQVQEGNDKTTYVTRTVDGDLLTNLICVDELTCTRIYHRA